MLKTTLAKMESLQTYSKCGECLIASWVGKSEGWKKLSLLYMCICFLPWHFRLLRRIFSHTCFRSDKYCCWRTYIWLQDIGSRILCNIFLSWWIYPRQCSVWMRFLFVRILLLHELHSRMLPSIQGYCFCKLLCRLCFQMLGLYYRFSSFLLARQRVFQLREMSALALCRDSF